MSKCEDCCGCLTFTGLIFGILYICVIILPPSIGLSFLILFAIGLIALISYGIFKCIKGCIDNTQKLKTSPEVIV